MDVDYRVISIGVFSAHPLWNEVGEVRTPHATTTLIRAGEVNLLVDPSLPPQILDARLHERSGLRLDAITHVFLTSFEPMRRRALGALPNATWWIGEREREAIGATLVGRLREEIEGEGAPDAELVNMLQQEVAVLERCQAAPDALVEGVDLFPLPGVTPGTCGLLLPQAKATVMVCGDAVPSVEHLREGRVLADAADVEQARESFSEAIEIADLMILGRDNMVLNPLRRPF